MFTDEPDYNGYCSDNCKNGGAAICGEYVPNFFSLSPLERKRQNCDSRQAQFKHNTYLNDGSVESCTFLSFGIFQQRHSLGESLSQRPIR